MYYLLTYDLMTFNFLTHALSHGFCTNYEINRTNILTIKNEETEAWGGLSKLPKVTWSVKGRILSIILHRLFV